MLKLGTRVKIACQGGKSVLDGLTGIIHEEDNEHLEEYDFCPKEWDIKLPNMFYEAPEDINQGWWK